jgi:hypothetical protein
VDQIVNGHLQPWLPEADVQNGTMIRAAGAAAALHDGGYDIRRNALALVDPDDVEGDAVRAQRCTDASGTLRLQVLDDHSSLHHRDPVSPRRRTWFISSHPVER